eukprot:5656337-Amphidinium_carterae.1
MAASTNSSDTHYATLVGVPTGLGGLSSSIMTGLFMGVGGLPVATGGMGTLLQGCDTHLVFDCQPATFWRVIWHDGVEHVAKCECHSLHHQCCFLLAVVACDACTRVQREATLDGQDLPSVA